MPWKSECLLPYSNDELKSIGVAFYCRTGVPMWGDRSISCTSDQVSNILVCSRVLGSGTGQVLAVWLMYN